MRGILDSIEPDCDQVVRSIDGLTAQDLNFPNVMAALPNELQRFGRSVARLDSLAAEAQRLTRDGGELDQMVKQAAGQPPATMTTGSLPGHEVRPEIVVET